MSPSKPQMPASYLSPRVSERPMKPRKPQTLHSSAARAIVVMVLSCLGSGAAPGLGSGRAQEVASHVPTAPMTASPETTGTGSPTAPATVAARMPHRSGSGARLDHSAYEDRGASAARGAGPPEPGARR